MKLANMLLILLLVAIAGLFCIPLVFAGVEVGGTRLIFLDSEKEANITMRNTEQTAPYLIQSWVEGISGNDKPPFVVTPPLFRLDGQQQNILRILKTPGDLPHDRESVFWLNIKSIPAIREDLKGKNVLQFSVKNRMKLFYRPVQLAGTTEQAAAGVRWAYVGKKLVAVNKSAYFVNLASIKVNGKKIDLDYTNNMIPPKGQMSYAQEAVPAGGKNIEWRAINDYGSSFNSYSAVVP